MSRKSAPIYGGAERSSKKKKKQGFPQFGAVIHSFAQVIHIKVCLCGFSQPPYVERGTRVSGSQKVVEAVLFMLPSTVLEFLASDSCDVSGNGEGEIYLGGEEVITDANGDVTFSINLTSGILEGYLVTGTATGPDSSTSEFSPCQTVVVTPPVNEDVNYNWNYDYDPLYRLTYACSDWDAVGVTGYKWRRKASGSLRKSRIRLTCSRDW